MRDERGCADLLGLYISAVSQNGSPRTRHPFRRFGAWLAALALAVQVFVIQPHVDVALAAQPQAHATAHVSGPSDHAQAACVICQALAVSGFVTLADAPALLSHSLLDITPAARAVLARTFPAHHWHSRGPPTL